MEIENVADKSWKYEINSPLLQVRLCWIKLFSQRLQPIVNVHAPRLSFCFEQMLLLLIVNQCQKSPCCKLFSLLKFSRRAPSTKLKPHFVWKQISGSQVHVKATGGATNSKYSSDMISIFFFSQMANLGHP